METQWGPKNWKKVPMGPRGSSVNHYHHYQYHFCLPNFSNILTPPVAQQDDLCIDHWLFVLIIQSTASNQQRDGTQKCTGSPITSAWMYFVRLGYLTQLQWKVSFSFKVGEENTCWVHLISPNWYVGFLLIVMLDFSKLICWISPMSLSENCRAAPFQNFDWKWLSSMMMIIPIIPDYPDYPRLSPIMMMLILHYELLAGVSLFSNCLSASEWTVESPVQSFHILIHLHLHPHIDL